MKILITALVLSIPTFAQANIEFKLSCEVKSNIIIAAQRMANLKDILHYDGEYVVGDTLNFMAQLKPNYTLYMRLNDPLRDEIIAGTLFDSKNIKYWNTEQMDFFIR